MTAIVRNGVLVSCDAFDRHGERHELLYNSAMRILMSLHHLLNPIRLAEALRDLGHEVGFLSMSDMNIPDESLKAHIQFPWFAYGQLKRRHNDYDVLDLSTGDGWLFQSLNPKARGLIVTRSHGLEHIADAARRDSAARGQVRLSWKYPLYHGGFRLWEVAKSLRTADLCLFLNKDDKDYAVKKLGVVDDRTAIVDNGVSDSFLGLPFAPTLSSGLRIAVVGTYNDRKINVLPRAVNRLFKEQPTWSIGFFGTGIDDEEVRNDYDADIQDRILIVQRYNNDELRGYLANYNLLLFPSLSEGLPVSVFEAMACGLALVASALPPLTERLTGGEEAIFFPIGDSEALCVVLRYLAASPRELLALREAGYRKAQHFSWKRIAQETSALYERALAEKRAKLRTPNR